MRNILAVAAHPDDETLGCGGTLLRHAAAGDRLHWAIATQAHRPQWSAEVIRRKRLEIERVARGYGMKRYDSLGFPSQRLDALPLSRVIEKIRSVVKKVKPEIVYVVHGGDVHSDHRIVFQATAAVLKSFYMRGCGVKRVLSYESASSTDAAPAATLGCFLPTVFMDITPYLERKIQIMNLYKSELQAPPFPRESSSLRALARHRGATVGVEYAEAFMLIREVL